MVKVWTRSKSDPIEHAEGRVVDIDQGHLRVKGIDPYGQHSGSVSVAVYAPGQWERAELTMTEPR